MRDWTTGGKTVLDKVCQCSLICKKSCSKKYAQGHHPNGHRKGKGSIGVKRSWQNSTVRKRRIQGIKAAWRNPRVRQKYETAAANLSVNACRSASLRRTMHLPGKREQYSQAHSKQWADGKMKVAVRKMRSKKNRLLHRRSMLKKLADGILGGNVYTVCWLDTVKAGRVFCRSSWEADFNRLCDDSDIIRSVKAEPCKIHYRVDGISRIYIPDRLIKFVDGQMVLVEIKPRSKWWRNHRDGNRSSVLKAKFLAAKRYCRNRGWKFAVLSKEDFGDFIFDGVF